MDRFVQSAQRGLAGTFGASYRVTGAHAGVIEVAQKQQPHRSGSGTWSFVYRAEQGFSSQWIERGSSSSDCWQAAGDTTWTCTGPGTYEQVNGFALATEPFIPGDVAGQLSQLQEDSAHRGWVKQIRTFRGRSKQFGELRCMSVAAPTLSTAATFCIDRDGVMVSEKNWPGGYFADVSLVRYATRPPATAFTLLGTVRPGSFVPVPQ